MRALPIVAALALQCGAFGAFAQEMAVDVQPTFAAADPCRAESAVVLRCDDAAGGARLKARLDRNRTTPDSDASSPAAVVITAQRPVDPNQQRWQRFDEEVALAAVPACASAGSADGLLAVPLVAIEAVEGACR